MISEEQLIAYQSGVMGAHERERLETELSQDAVALESLINQERVDAALRVIFGGAQDRAVVRRAIMEIALGTPHEQMKQRVMVGFPRRPQHWMAGVIDLAARRWRIAFSLALALGLIAIGMWRRTPPSKANASPATTAPTRRDPAEWPFAASSPWNTPIGSQATYGDVDPAGLNLNRGAMLVSTRLTHPLEIAQPTDPMARIYLRDDPAPWALVRIPRGLRLRPGGQWSLHLITEDHGAIIELTRVTRDGTNDLRAMNALRADLRGPGIPPQHRSATGSGLSAMAGSIRTAELSNGIPHALAAMVPVHAVHLRADDSAHVWPALKPSGDIGAWRQKLNPRGNVNLGTLLAIPASVNIIGLGVGASGPAFEIARTLQDYGVYVKDFFDGEPSAEWRNANRPELVFCADFDSRASLPPALESQLGEIVRHLKIVSNNSAQTVGGGGTRRRPAAPEFLNPAANTPPLNK